MSRQQIDDYLKMIEKFDEDSNQASSGKDSVAKEHVDKVMTWMKKWAIDVEDQIEDFEKLQDLSDE